MGNENIDEQPHKNLDFIQIPRKNIPALRQMALENPTAMNLFMFLGQYMDHYGKVICSQTVLIEVLGVSRKSIYNATKYLTGKNFIQVLKSGTANCYALNHDVVWSSWNTNKKYAAFQGNILISKSENEKFEKQLKKSITPIIEKKPLKKNCLPPNPVQ